MLAVESESIEDLPQPDNVKVLLEQATALQIRGDYRESLRLFRQARQLMLKQQPMLGGKFGNA